MENWYSYVRELKDEYGSKGLKVEEICHSVWHSLHRMKKLKDKGKFEKRMGPEFTNWSNSILVQYYDNEELVKEIINEDDFWILTLEVSKS